MKKLNYELTKKFKLDGIELPTSEECRLEETIDRVRAFHMLKDSLLGTGNILDSCMGTPNAIKLCTAENVVFSGNYANGYFNSFYKKRGNLTVMKHPSGISNSNVVTITIPMIINNIKEFGMSSDEVVYFLLRLYYGNMTKVPKDKLVDSCILNSIAPWSLAAKLVRSGFTDYGSDYGIWIDTDFITEIIDKVDSISDLPTFITNTQIKMKETFKVINSELNSVQEAFVKGCIKEEIQDNDILNFYEVLRRYTLSGEYVKDKAKLTSPRNAVENVVDNGDPDLRAPVSIPREIRPKVKQSKIKDMEL